MKYPPDPYNLFRFSSPPSSFSPSSSQTPPESHSPNSVQRSTSTSIAAEIENSTCVDTEPTIMFELTRSKLERAAQGQLTGRRGAPSLREIVLLSNVFGASRPQYDQERLQRELQASEIEKKQKEDEARWLDNVLEEMLELEEPDDEDDFVSVSFAAPIGDSGYLETGVKETSSRSPAVTSIVEEEEAYMVPIPDEGDDDLAEELPTSSSHQEPITDETIHHEVPDEPPIPTSTPIDVPPRSLRSALIPSFQPDFSPSSTPSACSCQVPSLTPDNSPSMPGSELLASSLDSLESDFGANWLAEHQTTKRPGLLSLEWSTSTSSASKALKSSSRILEMDDSLIFPITSVSFGPHPLPSEDSGLSMALVRAQEGWKAPTPRPFSSISAPPSPRQRPTFLPFAFPLASSHSYGEQGMIVRSFYDCVDFGETPLPLRPGGVGVSTPPRSRTASSNGSSPTKTPPSGSVAGKEDRALILGRSLFFSRRSDEQSAAGEGRLARDQSPFSLGMSGKAWRSRSTSPEYGRSRRRDWSRFTDLVLED